MQEYAVLGLCGVHKQPALERVVPRVEAFQSAPPREVGDRERDSVMY
jgi:hypothetical protein